MSLGTLDKDNNNYVGIAARVTGGVNTYFIDYINKDNENVNLLTATWSKYHCSQSINKIMKCIKLHY